MTLTERLALATRVSMVEAAIDLRGEPADPVNPEYLRGMCGGHPG